MFRMSLLSLLIAGTAHGQTLCPDGQIIPAHVATPATPAPIVYNGFNQTLYLYTPKGVTNPSTIFLIHGGGWNAGTATDFANEIGYFNYFGYAVATVNYRLASGTTNLFPAAVQDVRCAFRYVKQFGSSLGINATNIGVIGYSAGGNLAGMLQSNVPYEETNCLADVGQPISVQAVAAYYGVFNGVDFDPPLINNMKKYLGVNPQTNPVLASQATPTQYLSSTSPPFFISYGTDDTQVPPKQSTDFLSALQTNGTFGTLYAVQGFGHAFKPFGYLANNQTVLAPSTCAMLSFFKTYVPQ